MTAKAKVIRFLALFNVAFGAALLVASATPAFAGRRAIVAVAGACCVGCGGVGLAGPRPVDPAGPPG